MFHDERGDAFVAAITGTLDHVPVLNDTSNLREVNLALKSEIFIHSAIPSNFLGAQDGMSMPAVSGETIRKANTYPESWIVSTQEEVGQCAEDALRLATGNPNLTIEWKNPFEEMDVDRESDTIPDNE